MTDEKVPAKAPRLPERQVFNVGDLGVNLVLSPIHKPDGALQQGQNAVFSRNRGRHALMKRPGMARLNSSAAAGSILALIDVRFPDVAPPAPPTNTLYAYVNWPASADYTASSANGTTWAESALLAENDHIQTYGKSVVSGSSMYYPWTDPATGLWTGIINQWDGTTETNPKFTLSNISYGGNTYVPRQVYDMDADATYLYVLARYFATGVGYLRVVMRVTLADGTVSQLAETFRDTSLGALATVPHQIAVWNAEVWVSGFDYTNNHGMVWHVTPTGTNWTNDLDFGSGGFATETSIHGGGTELWAGFDGNTVVASVVRTRTVAGVWTTVLASTATLPTQSDYKIIYASGAACYLWHTTATTEVLKYTTDSGGSWNDLASLALAAIRFSKGQLFGSKVYCLVDDSSLLRIYELYGVTVTLVYSHALTGQNILGVAGS